MPKGVEHGNSINAEDEIAYVPFTLMPKGVEHIQYDVSALQPGDSSIYVDAERR